LRPTVAATSPEAREPARRGSSAAEFDGGPARQRTSTEDHAGASQKRSSCDSRWWVAVVHGVATFATGTSRTVAGESFVRHASMIVCWAAGLQANTIVTPGPRAGPAGTA
jgi:hypothetical protein